MTGLAELPNLIETRFAPIRTVAETGSTNADLLAAAARGAAEGSVLVTDHQTAGRGRQRRNWHDDPGNALLVSVLLRPGRNLAPLLPLLTGVAAVDAVTTLLEPDHADRPDRPVGLKWPNDVLAPALDDRKLAGILAESTTVAPARPGTDDEPMIVVVGMG
ncbi:MAG: biotin--[acetyl-CoA-carboxylase] ligase, partial [Acidimicrobiales bacterium]